MNAVWLEAWIAGKKIFMSWEFVILFHAGFFLWSIHSTPHWISMKSC
jgi:hypothetical protein